MPKVTHHSCVEMRVVRITHCKLNIRTGQLTDGHSETVTKPCDAPLFSDAERHSGLCRSCASGWSVEGNRKATEAEAIAATAAAAS